MGVPICIREFRLPDLAQVLAINAEGWPGVSRLDAAAVSDLSSTAPVMWVAASGTQVAGYLIGLLPESDDDGEEFLWFKERRSAFLYVGQIAIAASSRGRGIGRQFYEKLAQWSAVHGCTRLVCEVNIVPPNPESLAFHGTCGFTEVGRLGVSDGREVVLLERRIR